MATTDAEILQDLAELRLKTESGYFKKTATGFVDQAIKGALSLAGGEQQDANDEEDRADEVAQGDAKASHKSVKNKQHKKKKKKKGPRTIQIGKALQPRFKAIGELTQVGPRLEPSQIYGLGVETFRPSWQEEGADGADPGILLRDALMEELEHDATGFKTRMFIMDHSLKSGSSLPPFVGEKEATFASDVCFWNGCKFVNATLMHLTAPPGNRSARIKAVRHTAHSLGGTDLPDDATLARVKRVDVLEVAYEVALARLETQGVSSILAIGLTDVQIMKRPRETDTFAHMLCMTVSPAGVILFQGYGSRGYTLRQYLQRHKGDHPLSHAKGREWAGKLGTLLRSSVDSQGRWTESVNELYQELFEVNPSALGTMRVGSQFDPYVRVETFITNATDILSNLRSLPAYRGPRLECKDEQVAAGTKWSRHHACDGGVPRRYTPFFADYPLG